MTAKLPESESALGQQRGATAVIGRTSRSPTGPGIWTRLAVHRHLLFGSDWPSIDTYYLGPIGRPSTPIIWVRFQGLSSLEDSIRIASTNPRDNVRAAPYRHTLKALVLIFHLPFDSDLLRVAEPIRLKASYASFESVSSTICTIFPCMAPSAVRGSTSAVGGWRNEVGWGLIMVALRLCEGRGWQGKACPYKLCHGRRPLSFNRGKQGSALRVSWGCTAKRQSGVEPCLRQAGPALQKANVFLA